ncbi:MAG TPA: hypothetical protein PKK15_11585 [Kouleothrix sp.]|uniref:hypothetical protein n=1 Tax=Kouleothrix sp. TaxID=2779161 RepID=UPI002B73C902|nr:hypothetical protein [Kouleothrix sp.]
MSERMRMWVEVGFNIAYLLVVWWLVAAMFARRASVAGRDAPVARRMLAAFALLALGDTGHVGLRVLAYALGGLDARLALGSASVSLVGAGALATATTLTLFYMLVLDSWRVRFGHGWGIAALVLLGAGVARLAIMAFPQNAWEQSVPPQPWSLYRNLPLIVQGLGVAFLMLRDAQAHGDRLFRWIGRLILVSYACYLPVVFWVQRAPMIGMLMIPKTLAYVAIAILVYRSLYRASAASLRPRALATRPR